MIDHLPKGTFDMWFDNQVLVCCPKYSWSEYTAVKYADRMKALVAQLEGRQWGSTVLLSQWELGTPEVETVIGQLLQWCLDNGLQRLALVTGENRLQEFQLENMLTPEADGFERQFFACEEEANRWMTSGGFARN